MKEENKKISIIIPIYNVEKYIRQCLESVVSQTYKNLEIIVVNDGTKDNSMKIVEEYLSDKRIKAINKENGGLSSARNKGMEEVTGEYIYFLDSDDWLELNTIEILVKNLEENLEIIGANFYLFDEIKEEKRVNNLKVKYEEIEEGKYLLLNELEVVVWNKLYKTSFLRKNGIIFLENIVHEDEDFTFKCYMKAKRIKYIPNITYNYRVNRIGSIMNEIEKNENKRKFALNSLEIIANEMRNFYDESDDYFIQYRTMIREYLLKIRSFKLKNIIFSKEESFLFKNKIKGIKFQELSLKEKEIIRKELREIILKKEFINLGVWEIFFWKNKIINICIARKIISRKLRGIKNDR